MVDGLVASLKSVFEVGDEPRYLDVVFGASYEVCAPPGLLVPVSTPVAGIGDPEVQDPDALGPLPAGDDVSERREGEGRGHVRPRCCRGFEQSLIWW